MCGVEEFQNIRIFIHLKCARCFDLVFRCRYSTMLFGSFSMVQPKTYQETRPPESENPVCFPFSIRALGQGSFSAATARNFSRQTIDSSAGRREVFICV